MLLIVRLSMKEQRDVYTALKVVGVQQHRLGSQILRIVPDISGTAECIYLSTATGLVIK
jgi:hypothetical protein